MPAVTVENILALPRLDEPAESAVDRPRQEHHHRTGRIRR